ncbi:MAG: P1 family peptidase [Ilumatobacteraceae bacterium]
MAPSAPPFGSITDVDGLRVGHHQRIGRGWQTGTTVLFAPDGATPGVSVRGGGPGTRETDALHPENLVEQIHAVCLTGGSAFGLTAADGVVGFLEARGLGFPVGRPPDQLGVVPVVPAAVVFDLARAGVFTNRPDAGFGERAIRGAKRAQRSWGSVGAGTGAKAGGLQGGVGTASTRVTIPSALTGLDTSIDVTVGALAVVNAVGSPVDRTTGLPWDAPSSMLRRPSAQDRRLLLTQLDEQSAATLEPEATSLNTTIGVVATSAALSKSEVSKMSGVAHDGLARAIRPAHSMFDGDTIFGLATGQNDLGDMAAGMRSTPSRQAAFNLLLTAGADVFATACTHALVAATTIGTFPAYADLCPSAFRHPR